MVVGIWCYINNAELIWKHLLTTDRSHPVLMSSCQWFPRAVFYDMLEWPPVLRGATEVLCWDESCDGRYCSTPVQTDQQLLFELCFLQAPQDVVPLRTFISHHSWTGDPQEIFAVMYSKEMEAMNFHHLKCRNSSFVFLEFRAKLLFELLSWSGWVHVFFHRAGGVTAFQRAVHTCWQSSCWYLTPVLATTLCQIFN